MGVNRDKEEKVMCHDAAGTDTRILKKQVCPSRDEQDEREDGSVGWGAGQPSPSQPSQVQDAVYIILGSTSTQFPLCGEAERGEGGERGDTDDATRRIDNERIKATSNKNHEQVDDYP